MLLQALLAPDFLSFHIHNVDWMWTFLATTYLNYEITGYKISEG